MTHKQGLWNSLKLALLLLAACAALRGEAQASFVLVKDKQPACVLLVAKSPAAAEQFAAEELQAYVEKMTGVTLPILSEEPPGTPAIHVGATAAAKAKLDLKPGSSQDDQYRMLAEGDQLYLLGARGRGTLFAVYDVLERLGCRWFAPGYRFYKGLHETIPQVDTLALSLPLDVQEVPAFKYRIEFCEHYFLHEPDDVVALIDWCAKNRINGLAVRLNELGEVWYRVLYPDCAKRDLMLSAEGHAFERFLSRTEYFQQHPDWFGPVNGEFSDRYFDQIRITHPEARRTLEENVRKFVKQFPGLFSISALPNDSPRWSEEDLKEHDPLELLEMSYDSIARAVQETNPDMKVAIGVGVEYFGQDGTHLWDAPYSNIIWHTAVLRRTLKYPWNDPENKQNYPQYEKAARVTRQLKEKGQEVVWSSRYSPFRDMGLPGSLYAEAMATELKDLQAIGGDGINLNYAIPPAWIPYELKHYLYARLAWDPKADAAEIINAYYEGRFAGSPEAMKKYHAALSAAMERYEYPGGGYSREQANGLYPQDQFEQGLKEMDAARAALDEAAGANPNDGEKQIIWLLTASLRYGREKMEIDQLAQTGREEEAKERVADLMDWLEAWTMKGVVYDSSFLRMGMERRFLGPPRDVPIKGVPADNLRVYEFKDYGNGAQRQRLPEAPPPAPAKPKE